MTEHTEARDRLHVTPRKTAQHCSGVMCCRRAAGSGGSGPYRGDEEEAGQPGQRPLGCCQAAQHLPAGSLRLPVAGQVAI